MSASQDRNLLFGIVALQFDFVTRDQLVAAMHAWVLEKKKSLADLLVERDALTVSRRAMLEPLVDEHIRQHQGDPQRSLAALSSVDDARQALQEIKDPDLQASLRNLKAPQGKLSPQDYATIDPPPSAPTRFRKLRQHAKGGLGVVFVAHDQEVNRQVALKEIQSHASSDPDARQRFQLEAEITGGLEHPGIVPVYGLGHYADGQPYYAMRFIKGISLKEAVDAFHAADKPGRDATERGLSLRALLRRFIDVCNAVDYAHSKGVLHRDLKPGNIMLGKYGETLVVDWGLAKATGKNDPIMGTHDLSEAPLKPTSGSGSAPTQMGSAIGTPAFMPPEQAAGRLDLLGPASDVYSLGATLYYVLTGKPPFENPDLVATLNSVQKGTFPSPRQIKQEIDRSLEAICLKAMKLNQSHRYQSAYALANDIEKWLADEPVSAYETPLRDKFFRWVKRHSRVASFAAFVALAVAVIGAVATAKRIESDAKRRRVAQLWDAHPEFHVHSKLFSDPGKLNFNHDLHMRPGLGHSPQSPLWRLANLGESWRKTYRHAGQGDNDPVILQCKSCHQLDSSQIALTPDQLLGLPINSVLPVRSSGELMLPIVFELHCQACHTIGIGEDNVITRRLEKGDIITHRLNRKQIHLTLERIFAAKGVESLKKANADASKVLRSIDVDVKRAEESIYETQLGVCVSCHEPSRTPGKTEWLEPTQLPGIWLPEARFSHSAQREGGLSWLPW